MDGDTYSVPVCSSCTAELDEWKNLYRNQCPTCGTFLLWQRQDCPRCHESEGESPLETIRCVGPFRGIGRRIVLAYKKSGYRRLCGLCADLLEPSLAQSSHDCLIVPVPSQQKNVRKRGFDHMACICRELAARTNCGYASLLIHLQEEQKGLTRQQRLDSHGYALKHLLFFRRTAISRIPWKTMLLVDDVRTSGGTLHHCAGLLSNVFQMPIHGLVLCDEP